MKIENTEKCGSVLLHKNGGNLIIFALTRVFVIVRKYLPTFKQTNHYRELF